MTSSRALYAELHDSQLRPGDYVLVSDRFLPGGGQSPSRTLLPAPVPPYLQRILSVKAETSMTLFRVLPGAAFLPVPATPQPPAYHWWNRFDTD